jgi:hypothetical protein
MYPYIVFIPVFARVFGKIQYFAPREFRDLVLSCSTVANAINVNLALVTSIPQKLRLCCSVRFTLI